LVFAGRGEKFAVRMKRQGVDRRRVRRPGTPDMPAFRVALPQPDRLILAGACEEISIRMKGNTGDGTLVTGESFHQLATIRIPDLDSPIVAGAGQEFAVGTVGNGGNRLGVVFERFQ